MAEKLYTTEEAAAYLHFKPLTVRQFLCKGIINGIKVSNEWRIPDSDLQAYVNGLKAKRDHVLEESS